MFRKSLLPFIVHPETVVHAPESSHVTEIGLAVPLYPIAQDTDEVPPYAVALVPENIYPGSDGLPQS